MTAEEIKRTIFRNLLEAEQNKETYGTKVFLGALGGLKELVEDLGLECEYNEYKKNK